MTRRHPAASEPDPLAVLGLRTGASEAAIVDARRRLAKRAHPDVGGSLEEMQRVNLAAERALQHLAAASGAVSPRRPTPSPPTQRRYRGDAQRDHPSFTIEVLPVEAFEGLLVVASWLGDLIHDDPPYLLEVALSPPIRGWCRLDLVPDAGASTVSLAVAAEPGYPTPDVEEVRDAWIAGLNRLDWSGPDDSPRP